MTRLDLTEWSTSGGVVLDNRQVRALANSTMFSIQPDPTAPGHWSVGAGRHVGMTQFGDLEIRVRPKVGVRRLVELLEISHQRIIWDPGSRPNLVESSDLLGVIAEAYAREVSLLLHHGLLQGYRTVEDALPTVQGRVQMATQMARRPLLPLPVELTFDEFGFDVPENRILVSAARRLLPLRSLTRSARAPLRRLDHQLRGLAMLVGRAPDVTFTRLNDRYKPAISLARLILEASSLEEAVGRHHGTGFLIDMDKVFEDVVGLGLRRLLEPTGLSVDLQSVTPLDVDALLTIRPDIVVRRSDGQVVAVADIKYKQPDNKISPGDVYQALAYANRFGLSQVHLIYADTPPVTVQIGDVQIQFAHVDLTNPEPHIQDLSTRLGVQAPALA